MPELPEAETIARGLDPLLQGRRLGGARVIHPDLLDLSPDDLHHGLRGQTVRRVGRRGKNVVVELENGFCLVINLGMSGRLLWRPGEAEDPYPSHPAVIVPAQPEGSGELIYHDPRRFGRIQLLDPAGFRRWSATLGPEPLASGFTARALANALQATRTPLRSFLLDQRRIAGVGNIYASEACHRAGLHPALPSSSVDAAGARRLHRALRRVLEAAVQGGGTTLRDYRTAQGWEGNFQHDLAVYGREGKPCRRCGTVVVRIVFSNRSAFYCPRCQPEP